MPPRPAYAMIAVLIAVSIPTAMPAVAFAGVMTRGTGDPVLIEGGCGQCYEDYVDGFAYHSFSPLGGDGPLSSDGAALAGPSMFECNGVDGHTTCDDDQAYRYFRDVSHDRCGGGSLLTADVDRMEAATTVPELLSLVIAHAKNVRVNVKRSALELVDCQGRLDGHIPISPELLPQMVASLTELQIDHVVLGA